MQEVRSSIPGRGTTDFCTLILFVYKISCIVLFSVSENVAEMASNDCLDNYIYILVYNQIS